MEKFASKIDDYLEDNRLLKRIVRNFDEAMATKANKCALKLVEEEFMRRYIHVERWHEIHDKVEDIRKKLDDDSEVVRKEMTDFKTEQNANIYKICLDLLNNKYSKYDKVLKDFEKYSTMDALSIQFDSKADVRQLESLNKAKANKDSLQLTNSNLKSLYDRVKHISIVQNELANSLLPIKNSISTFDDETKQSIL